MRVLASHTLLGCFLAFTAIAGCGIPNDDPASNGTHPWREPPDTHADAYSKNVSVRQDTAYLDGRPFSGYLLYIRPNGDTAACIGYVDGVQEGTGRVWHANGRLSEERNFHLGRKIGIHRGWWPNGNPRFEYTFLNGEHHGAMLEWYEDGTPYKAFHHRMGYEDGSQRMWWEDGRVRANYVVRNGRRYGLIGVKNCVNPKDSLDR